MGGVKGLVRQPGEALQSPKGTLGVKGGRKRTRRRTRGRMALAHSRAYDEGRATGGEVRTESPGWKESLPGSAVGIRAQQSSCVQEIA